MEKITIEKKRQRNNNNRSKVLKNEKPTSSSYSMITNGTQIKKTNGKKVCFAFFFNSFHYYITKYEHKVRCCSRNRFLKTRLNLANYFCSIRLLKVKNRKKIRLINYPEIIIDTLIAVS